MQSLCSDELFGRGLHTVNQLRETYDKHKQFSDNDRVSGEIESPAYMARPE